MVGLVLSLGALAAIVWHGVNRSLAPAKKETAERRKLTELKDKRTRLTLDEAEDGLVLARRYGDAEAFRVFAPVVTELKKKRVKI